MPFTDYLLILQDEIMFLCTNTKKDYLVLTTGQKITGTRDMRSLWLYIK